jgi:hypothetical protein
VNGDHSKSDAEDHEEDAEEEDEQAVRYIYHDVVNVRAKTDTNCRNPARRLPTQKPTM